jgi:uncharacterized membrane protein YcaP (DUF421 family)
MFNRWVDEVFASPDGLTLLVIVGRTVLLYLFVVLALRLLGTRELGERSAFDLVLIVVIGNAIQNALVAGDNTLTAGLVSAATLLLVNLGFSKLLNRFPRLEKSLSGEPVVLISDGRSQPERMRQEGVSHDELIAALREHGVLRVEDVRLAVLETDGAISVVPQDARVHRTRRKFKNRQTT